MKPLLLTVVSLYLFFNTMPVWGADYQIEQSVVRITNYQQNPDWQAPWKMASDAMGTGSGFLVDQQWLLTNAHVVSNSRLLLVNKIATPKLFVADVVAIAHDSDLAILKVRDPSFYQDLRPLKFGKLPELQSRVSAYGYPVGGQKISRTEGGISRIEFGAYVHSGIDSHLLAQTDTAINPGNSGGPVIQDEKVVGVAFQSNPELNDVGYVVPVPLITRFFQDLKDGTYDGVPEIGVLTSELLNPYHRQFLGIPDGFGGVLVDRVLPNSAAEGVLLPGDVLVSIDGHPIDEAGLIEYEGHRVSFFIIAEDKQVHDPIKVRLWRDKKFHDLKIILKPPPYERELRNSYDVLPEYLICGGLVFMPLNRDYMRMAGNAVAGLLYEYWFNDVENPKRRREQIIVMIDILPAPVNSGYSGFKNFILDQVNGRPIHSLNNLKAVLDELKTEPYYVFESRWTPLPIVLERSAVERDQEVIYQRYGIAAGARLHQN